MVILITNDTNVVFTKSDFRFKTFKEIDLVMTATVS
jgi:hypothetical protein